MRPGPWQEQCGVIKVTLVLSSSTNSPPRRASAVLPAAGPLARRVPYTETLEGPAEATSLSSFVCEAVRAPRVTEYLLRTGAVT